METAAIRELHEETGFKADKILQLSPIIVSDPGTFPVLQDHLRLLTGAPTRHDKRQHAAGRS